MDFHTSCLLCNATNLVKLKGYEHAYLLKCSTCNFVFSGRIPSLSELEKHYSAYPRNSSISEITLKRYDELLSGFEKYRKHNTILDIGCGDGHFLERAKSKGWNVYGTEFTKESVAHCTSKNISMFSGKLSTSAFNVPFDIITSFEVIEHINNPVEEIHNIHSMLRAGGMFYFTTPNFNSLNRLLLKNKWNVIEYPEHLSYYSCKSIHSLLSIHGFVKKSLKTTGISVNRLSQGLSSSAHRASARFDEQVRSSTENIFILAIAKKIANSILSFLKVGDTIKGRYVKL